MEINNMLFKINKLIYLNTKLNIHVHNIYFIKK